MAYTWSNDLATGNEKIDKQHKQLVSALNDLIGACASGQGRAKLNSTLDFLIDYVVQHFADEEKLQQQFNYPGYASHKNLHEAFKINVGELAKSLKTEGATVVLVGKVNSFLGGWLIKHIKQEDMKVAAHIRSVKTQCA